MSFKLQNIGGHLISTLWGILFMSALLALVVLGKCSLADIRPWGALVIPFLLYGSAGSPPAGNADSTTAPELSATPAPGA